MGCCGGVAMKRLVWASVVALMGCGDFPAIGPKEEPYITVILESKDSVAIRAILDANSLQNISLSGVADISIRSKSDHILNVHLYQMNLDALHIPNGLVFGTPKITFSARLNQFKSWQKEAERIPGLVSLDLSRNPIVNWSMGDGNASLTNLSMVDCGFSNLNLSVSGFPSLKEVYVGGNQLQDLPSLLTSHPTLKMDVYGNRICNPSPAVDAFLQRYNRDWRKNQVCPSS
jgi:Leucine-rich repeat (LRR) protein